MEPTLTEIETLARQAGEILRGAFSLRPGFGAPLKIDRKGEIDLVTEIDRRSEAFLIGEIRGRYPDHGIVAEESGSMNAGSRCLWYLDPLDGTLNYAHGLPIFSVSIAYQQDGQVRLGAVYDPTRDECFSAERGRGAWLNGSPIRPSTIGELDRSMLVTGFPSDLRTNPDNNLDHFVRFSQAAQSVRRLGSAALDMCYVAAGRLDGCWEIRLSAWDVAAGGLIAEEAGAVATDLHGERDYLIPPHSIVVANRSIHPQMLDILHSA